MISEPSNDKRKPRRNIAFYYVIALLILILLNALLFPSLMQRQVTEVGYNTFLSMLEEGRVQEIAYEGSESQIVFIATDESGSEQIYKTGIFPDLNLVDRIEDAPNEVTYANEIPTQNSPLLSFLLTWILPMVIILGIGSWFYSSMIKKMTGGEGMPAMSFGKSGAKIYAETETGKTFADVAGQDEAKEALKEIVDFLHSPQKYAEIGARLPKGALLVGPPGTGKTLLARAVAGEAGVPFFSISGSDFVEMFVGVGASRVRDLFTQGKKNAPCLIFIDEIDAVGRHRGAGLGGGHDEREQTLNQILVQMDGFETNEGIIVMAATNRADILDPALLRPGRFDRQIHVNLPDVKGREQILKVHARNKPIAPDVNFRTVARMTVGFSGADLANLLNEAAILAARGNKKLIGNVELYEAIDKVLMGLKKKSHVVTEADKRICAYHESGHAVLAGLCKHCDPVHEVTIIPRGSGAGGFTMTRPDEDGEFMSYNQMVDRICMSLGGRVAEEIVLKDVTQGASADLQSVSSLARRMVTQFGMSEKLGLVAYENDQPVFMGMDYELGGGSRNSYSQKTAAEIDDEVRRIVSEQHERAIRLLTENRSVLDNMSRVLVERETIYTEEVEMLMKGASYTEVIEFMDREGDKRKDNPFERFSDAAPAAPQPGV